MTDREQLLAGWLRQAIGIIGIEARDHEENRQWDDRNQRREVAKVLRSFNDAALKALGEVGNAP